MNPKETLSDHALKQAVRGIGYIGYHSSSIASGMFWIGMKGGRPTGHLHGVTDSTDGSITGNAISYIYPDMKTALVGKFKDGKMQNAQESELLSLGCNENGLLYVTQYSKLDAELPHYYYEPPKNISFGSGPPGAIDPYERKWLEVRDTNDANMGQGVFTKRDLEPDTLVSSYNGFAFDKKNGELDLYRKSCIWNKTKSDNERRHCLKYDIYPSGKDILLSIPPEFDLAESFIPSMGPKVIHIILFTKIYAT